MNSQSRVDMDAALASVAPKVRRTFELAHERLNSLGIPHVIVGGLAVNAHGHHYSTQDVDFLVSEQDAFEGTVILSHRPGVPFNVDGVAVDYVVAREDFPPEVVAEMARCLSLAARTPEVIVVASDWLLVWMKLNAGRTKDLAAVEGMLRVGLDESAVRGALLDAGPARVINLFNRCADAAAGGEK